MLHFERGGQSFSHTYILEYNTELVRTPWVTFIYIPRRQCGFQFSSPTYQRHRLESAGTVPLFTPKYLSKNGCFIGLDPSPSYNE